MNILPALNVSLGQCILHEELKLIILFSLMLSAVR